MQATPAHFTPVPLDKAYRLLNHGPTVLVSAEHAGQHNVMAAAWACALDFSPPKVTVVPGRVLIRFPHAKARQAVQC